MSHRFPFPSDRIFPVQVSFVIPVSLQKERQSSASVNSRTEFAINEGDRSGSTTATPTLQSVYKSDCGSIGFVDCSDKSSASAYGNRAFLRGCIGAANRRSPP